MSFIGVLIPLEFVPSGGMCPLISFLVYIINKSERKVSINSFYDFYEN